MPDPVHHDASARPRTAHLDDLLVDDFVPKERADHHLYGPALRDLPEASSAAASRTLIRTVPLVYGVLLGALADQVVVGVLLGTAVGAGFDLAMKRDSLLRKAAQRSRRAGCPVFAAAIRRTTRVLHGLRMPAPDRWLALRCHGPRE